MIMKVRRAPPASFLQFEPLESRLALAGLVSVFSKGTSLRIVGDASANDISISLVDNNTQWQITGNNDTTVRLGKTGQAGSFQTVKVPTGSVKILTNAS